MDNNSKHRQRPIPVTDQERSLLEKQRELYEAKSGKTDDWGDFLGTIALLGLAAAGIYALANATRQTPQSAQVECSQCHKVFILALPNQAQRVVYTRCPHCQFDLVVNLGNK